MQLLDLKTARRYLWNTFSSIPYDESNVTEVAAVNQKINLCSERFLSNGSYRGSFQRAVVTAYDSQITSPRELQTVLAAKINTACRGALVHPIWYEFLAGSFACGTSGLNDLGECFCTFRDIPSDLPLVIRSAEDVGSTAVLTVVVQNTNGVGQFDVPLNVAATQIDSPLANKILRMTKPVTSGRIEIYYKESGVEVKIASLKPSETDANYRRYRVSSSATSVDAIWKRAFVPAVADIEPVVPNNIGALKLMGMSLQFEDKNDDDRSNKYLARAIALADSDRQQFDGDNQTPLYNVTRGFGAADIPDIGMFGYRGDYVGHYG